MIEWLKLCKQQHRFGYPQSWANAIIAGFILTYVNQEINILPNYQERFGLSSRRNWFYLENLGQDNEDILQLKYKQNLHFTSGFNAYN